MSLHDDNDNENHAMEHEVLLDEDEEQQFLNDLDGPDIVEAATTTQEELFDSLLPPLNHVVIPNASRRRAHTVEAETPRRASESIILVRSTIGDDLSLLFDDDDSTLGVSLEDEEDDEGEVEEDPSFLRPIGGQQRPLRLTLSQESRLQRRQKLVNSRCVRGFMLLCVYGILVLQPSLTADTTNSSASLVEPLDTPTTVKTTTTAASGAASVKQDDNEKAESTSSSSKPAAAKATPRKTLPLENLPKFRRRPKGSGFKTPPPPARRSAASAAASQPQQQQQEHKGQPEKEQHMALPPHIYHKKQRPILSAAHSYQLHQEPLFFGRELKTSFVLESSDGDRERPSPIPWGTTLIWLSLICLLCDTSYREWQYYRWHRQHSSSSSSSNNNNNNARSRHHRRSPSPVPNSRQNSRNNHHHRHRARQQQRRRPQRPRFDSF